MPVFLLVVVAAAGRELPLVGDVDRWPAAKADYSSLVLAEVARVHGIAEEVRECRAGCGVPPSAVLPRTTAPAPESRGCSWAHAGSRSHPGRSAGRRRRRSTSTRLVAAGREAELLAELRVVLGDAGIEHGGADEVAVAGLVEVVIAVAGDGCQRDVHCRSVVAGQRRSRSSTGRCESPLDERCVVDARCWRRVAFWPWPQRSACRPRSGCSVRPVSAPAGDGRFAEDLDLPAPDVVAAASRARQRQIEVRRWRQQSSVRRAASSSRAGSSRPSVRFSHIAVGIAVMHGERARRVLVDRTRQHRRRRRCRRSRNRGGADDALEARAWARPPPC